MLQLFQINKTKLNSTKLRNDLTFKLIFEITKTPHIKPIEKFIKPNPRWTQYKRIKMTKQTKSQVPQKIKGIKKEKENNVGSYCNP